MQDRRGDSVDGRQQRRHRVAPCRIGCTMRQRYAAAAGSTSNRYTSITGKEQIEEEEGEEEEEEAEERLLEVEVEVEMEEQHPIRAVLYCTLSTLVYV